MEQSMDEAKKTEQTPAVPIPEQVNAEPAAEQKSAPTAAEQKSAGPVSAAEQKGTEAAPDAPKPPAKPKVPEPEYYTLKAKPPKKKAKEDVEAAKKIANRYLGIQALEKIVNAKKARQKKKAAEQRFKPPETPEEFYERGQRYVAGAECAVPFQEQTEYYRRAAEMFAGAGDYSDAAELAENCAKLAEQVEWEGYDTSYSYAMECKQRASTNDEWFEAARAFERIPGYRDADEQAAACQAVLTRRANLQKPLTILKVALVFVVLIGAVMLSRTDRFHYHFARLAHRMGLENVAATFLSYDNEFGNSEELLEEIYYESAVEYMEDGNYKKALTNLEKCQVVTSEVTARLDECHYALGDAAFKGHHNKTAKEHFRACTEGYKDCPLRIDECNYYQGLDALEKEDYEAAYGHFSGAHSFKDSDHYAYETELKLFQSARVGDKVHFAGDQYLLLHHEGQVLTLLSNQVEELPYNRTQEAVTWSKSTLRQELNSQEHLDSLFTAEEQALLTPVAADGGTDLVYVLSQQDFTRYRLLIGAKNALWWLQDQGAAPDTAMFVSGTGGLMEAGYPVSSTEIGARIAVQITLPEE